MSIGVLLRGFIGDMMDFGDVILRTLFPSFMTIQACVVKKGNLHEHGGAEAATAQSTQGIQNARRATSTSV